MDFCGDTFNTYPLASPHRKQPRNPISKQNTGNFNTAKNSICNDSSKSSSVSNQCTSKCNDDTPKYQPYYKAGGLPKELTEMFGALHCLLCDVHVASNMTAKSHYQGKTHVKKIKSYLINWCKKTGKPMPELPTPRIQKCETNLGKDRCSLCDVTFKSLADAEIHLSGKNHMKRLQNPDRPLKKRKIANVPEDPTGRFGIGINFITEQVPLLGTFLKTENELKPTFFCDLCCVHAIDENQLKQHLNGARHFKALRVKTSTVVPAPANPADSILASVCRPDDNLKMASDHSMHRTPTGHYYCQVCNLTMNSEEQFTQHVDSKKHKAKLSSRKPQTSVVKDSVTSN